jgi:hypothetical protein
MALDWPFEHFDPKNDLVMPYFNCLHSIALRAQAILHSRDSKEIVVAAQIVCMMLEEYYTGEAGYTWTEESPDPPSPVVEKVSWGSPDNSPAYALAEKVSSEPLDLFCLETEAKYLRDHMSSFSFDEPGFKNPRQEELFSAFALWCVADVLEALDPLGLFPFSGEKETGLEKETSLDSINTAFMRAGERALVAMDAVCYAEQLLEKGGAPAGSGDSGADGSREKEIVVVSEEMIKRAHRALSSKGGKARSAGNDLSKKRIIEYYDKYRRNYRCLSQMMRQMCKDFGWHDQPPETIRRWILELRPEEKRTRKK